MKIKFKVLIVLFLLIVLTVSHVYALDMFLTQDSNTSTEASNNDNSPVIEDESQANTDINFDDATYTNDTINKENEPTYSEESIETIGESSPTVTTTSSVKDNTLTISDIIDIILIAVCVVLILLAIAILIRCR